MNILCVKMKLIIVSPKICFIRSGVVNVAGNLNRDRYSMAKEKEEV